MNGDPEEYLPSQDEIEAAFAAPGTNGHVSKLELVSATDFMASDLPEPPQVVKGLLHQGSKFCIGGASKACKTWALLDLALSVNSGRPWINFETTAGAVLYINFEIQSFAWQRRVKIVATRRDIQDLSNIHFLNLRGKTSNFSQLIPDLIELLKTKPFVLIIIDPIYKLYGATDENSARDVAMLLNSIEHLATESGAAVAYASHFSKGNQAQKEAIDRVSGSGVFARDPDSLMMLTKHAEDDCFSVESILRNFAPVEPFVVRWEFPLLLPQENLNPQDLKTPGGRPAQYNCTSMLELLDDNSLSTTEWCKNCSDELGMSRRHFFNLIKSLESDGLILKSKINGKWAKCN